MAITVRPPTVGQLMVQKITDYRLNLVASERFLSDHGPFETQADPAGYPVIGYIPDMIYDEELDYLNELGLTRVALASNSVPVQLRLIGSHGGFGVVHDFALSSHTHLRKILPDHISLTRSFYLIRQQGDQRSDRMNRIVESLIIGLCAVVEDLEGHT